MKSLKSPSDEIRAHLDSVMRLRKLSSETDIADASLQIKRLQARRFTGTYRDFLADGRYEAACRFFLDELYGEQNFIERDAQFGSIAGAIERLFPEAVGQLAVDLAETHALTESLDHRMAVNWLATNSSETDPGRYVTAWRRTGQREERMRQLEVVEHMGRELQRLTRMKSLLLTLRMMRQPARLANLSALQQFLERGFSAFARMNDATPLLAAISEREGRWIHMLFDSDADDCERYLRNELARCTESVAY